MISIILPVYNAERFLSMTIQTVLQQTCVDWELIAVDDGSSDNTPVLLQEFARQDTRIRVVTQANGGCAVARNTGLKHVSADADHVIFFDHDDLWEPDALETLLQVAQAHTTAVAVIGGVAKLDDTDAEGKFRALRDKSARLHTVDAATLEAVQPPVLETVTFADTAVFCCAVTMGQVLIRRDALDRVGPLRLECVPCDDWELYLRLLMLGPMAKGEQNVVYWRSHATNTSKNHKRMYKAEMQVRLSLLARADLTPEQSQQVRDGFKQAKKQLSAQQIGYAAEHLQRRDIGEALRQLRYALRNYARSFQSVPAPSISTPAISSNSVS